MRIKCHLDGQSPMAKSIEHLFARENKVRGLTFPPPKSIDGTRMNNRVENRVEKKVL